MKHAFKFTLSALAASALLACATTPDNNHKIEMKYDLGKGGSIYDLLDRVKEDAPKRAREICGNDNYQIQLANDAILSTSASTTIGTQKATIICN